MKPTKPQAAAIRSAVIDIERIVERLERYLPSDHNLIVGLAIMGGNAAAQLEADLLRVGKDAAE